MCQVYCDVKREFNVSKNVFQPKPDVDSSLLSFYPKNKKLPNPHLFSAFIKQAFSQRRKKLKNNLSALYKGGFIDAFSNLRPEEVSPNNYVQMYKMIYID